MGMARALSTSFAGDLSGGGEHAAHHAARAQMAHEGARIEIGDHRDAALRQEAVGLFVGAPVARDMRKLAHGEAFDIRLARLRYRRALVP